MTLIAEDGSGRGDANAYADVAYADAYHGLRGHAAWAAATLAARAAALVKASDCLDAVYRFRGERRHATQALAWPRLGAEDNVGVCLSGVPDAVRRACAELALKALSEELLPDERRGGRVISESLGPLSATYSPHAPAGTVRRLADGLLREVVRSGLDVVRG